MENNKYRYELILGFVTLILSFSAFKDELAKVNLNIGFFEFTLADYLLKMVYGFGICIYLYIIERIARQSKRLSTWKFVDYIEKTAFILFAFIIFSPFILLLISIVYLGFNTLTGLNKEAKASIIGIITSILGVISGALSTFIMTKFYRHRDSTHKDEIEREEISELENAVKLFDEKFYSQAILEAFKVLEIHIIKLLSKRQINIPRNQFNFIELFNYAKKLELIDGEDIQTIDEIRRMRNSAAHLNKTHTRQQAQRTIKFIKYLIQKTNETPKD